jgi:hypothetical protein
VALAGEKFSDMSVDTPWGMVMVTAPPEGGAVVTAEVVEVEVGALVLVAVVVVEVEVGVLVLVAVVEVTTAEELDAVVEVVTAAEEVEMAAEEVEMAVVDEEETAVVVLVELAVIVGLPAPFVVHHMVVHVDDEAVAVAVVEAAALDAEVVVAALL